MKPVTACLALLLFALATTPATAGAASKSPRVIRVRTEPAVSGITLTFKGRRYVTDADGRALIPRPRGMAANQALPRIAVGSRTVDARTVVRFARWFRVGPTRSRRSMSSAGSAGDSSTRAARSSLLTRSAASSCARRPERYACGAPGSDDRTCSSRDV